MEDPVIGFDVERVASIQPLDIAVEAVGVLHRELSGPKHGGAGTQLVALLGLQVIEPQWQVTVGADVDRDVVGDVLLVGHREHEVRVLAVSQLEQLVDVVAAREAPQLGGLEHRHQHLVGADRIEL